MSSCPAPIIAWALTKPLMRGSIPAVLAYCTYPTITPPVLCGTVSLVHEPRHAVIHISTAVSGGVGEALSFKEHTGLTDMDA